MVYQKVHNAPLSPEDEECIGWWRRKYSKAIWLWAVLFTLFAVLMAVVAIFCREEDILLVDMLLLVFTSFPLFFIWKLIVALQKMLRVNSARRRGVKQLITGTLQDLKPDIGNRLLYKIDDNITIVITRDHLSGLPGTTCSCLQPVQVRLETLSVAPKDNLLLAIHYEDVPPPTIITAPVSTLEKNAAMIPWNKRFIITLLCSLPGIFLLDLLFTGKVGTPLFIAMFVLFAVVAACLAFATFFNNRRLQKYKAKVLITGIVTEAIAFVHDNEGAEPLVSYWYRIDKNMLRGIFDHNHGLLPGDKACFEYFVNQKGEWRDVIKVTKLL